MLRLLTESADAYAAKSTCAQGTSGGLLKGTFYSGRGNRNKEGSVPGQIDIPLPKFGRPTSGWQIYWHLGVNKTGILEVDFVCRTPNASPRFPDGAQVMQIFGSRCDHIEREPIFVSAATGGRDWVMRLTAKKLRVQALLFAVAPACGCDPWLDPSASRQVYESLREWLKWGN